MKGHIIILTLLVAISMPCLGQMERYDSLTTIADQQLLDKEYRSAATLYAKAFNLWDGKGMPKDKYNAAKAWSMDGVSDSAFYHLQLLASATNFLDYPKLIKEVDFVSLHNDERWLELLDNIRPHNEIPIDSFSLLYNDSLAALLTQLYDNDQKYRLSLRSVRQEYGIQSEEYKNIGSLIDRQDSIVLSNVIQILDEFGWLSVEEVGEKGNKVLWLAIQHADLMIQEKYFPIMQKAVKQGIASKKHLAYLHDRILVRQGKGQLYGTQYRIDFKTNERKLEEVMDPNNLNKRRESVGLAPMKE